jgi:hypothetical protein
MSKEEDKTILMGGQATGPANAAAVAASIQPKAKLICLDSSMLPEDQHGIEILLENDEQTIGRSEDNTATINFSRISRHHARIYPEQGKWIIEDLGSANGVWINETRTKEAILRSGDNIRIGAIPFLFDFSRPEELGKVAESGEDDAEETLFFGGMANDTDKIIKSLSSVEEQNKIAEDKEEHLQSGAVSGKASGSSRKIMKPVILLVLFLLIGGGGYFVYPMLMVPDGKEAVVQHRKAVKLFAEDFETVGGTTNIKSIQSQLKAISKIRVDLEREAQPFPDNLQFKKLLFQVIFFQVERQFSLYVASGEAERVVPLLDTAIRMVYFLAAQQSYDGEDLAVIGTDRTAIGELKTLMAGSELFQARDKEFQKDALGMLDILTFANDVVFIKHFRQKYPDLFAKGKQRPSAEELSDFSTVRKRFVQQKKRPGINIILSVRFPFFGNIVSRVDEDDLRFLDQWYELIG